MNVITEREALVFLAIVSVANGYKEEPKDYEAEGVSHIDYEKDQMPIKMSRKMDRKLRYVEDPSEYENESVRHINYEENQTPAEDRNWQVKPKVRRMSRGGKKVHIYLKNEDSKPPRPRRQTTTTTTTTTHREAEVEPSTTETQTKRTPELTTKADTSRNIKYVDKDNIASGSSNSNQLIQTISTLIHRLKQAIIMNML